MTEPRVTQPEALREALAELVALRDLKKKAEEYATSWDMTGCVGRRMPFYEESMAEYTRRQPLAWEAARAALEAHGAPEPNTRRAKVLGMMADAAADPAHQQAMLEAAAEGRQAAIGAPGNWVGSIPAEESDEEFARQVTEMDGHQAQAVASSPEALVKALKEAAQSLRTIERLAGRGEYMEDFVQVRGYAGSRAIPAESALADQAQAVASSPEAAIDQLRWVESPSDYNAWWVRDDAGRIWAKVGSTKLGGGQPYYIECPLGTRGGEYVTIDSARAAALSLAETQRSSHTAGSDETTRGGVGAEPPALTDEQIDAAEKAYAASAVPAWTSNRHRPALAAALRAALSAAPIGVPADPPASSGDAAAALARHIAAAKALLPPGTCVGAVGTRCLMKDR